MCPPRSMSYLTLFIWSFLAATFVPLGSEPMLIALARQGHSPATLVTVATIGNYLGACTTYWLARGAVRVLRKRSGSSANGRATRLVAAYGAPALIFSWVPLIGDALVAAAGVARMPFGLFSFWTALGKGLRYAALAWGAAAW